jgi:hypothetical protein
MSGIATTTQRMLGQARQAHDVVKTLCLNDKLSQVDVATRSATDRLASLKAAVHSNDIELASHEFTICTVLAQRAQQISTEANQCIGEEAAFLGATNVVTTVDPGITGQDPTIPEAPLWTDPLCVDCGDPSQWGPAITASANM